MATADEYANWIVQNADKKGTPDFETVAQAYRMAKGEESSGPPSPPEPSFLDKLSRQAGLTGRYAVEGMSALTDPINRMLGIKTPGEVLTKYGVPEPVTLTERVVGDISRMGVGTMMGLGAGGAMSNAAGPVTQGVGQALSSQPAMQALAAATGGGASGITREAGGGPLAQLGAGLLGAATPFAAQGVGSMAARGLARGGEAGRQQLADRLQTLQGAGVGAPSVGIATGNRGMQQAEAALSQVSASSGVFDRAAGQMAAGMGAKAEDIAAGLAPNASATRAGLSIEGGIKNFVSRFKGKQSGLYDVLDKYLPPETPVPVTNIMGKLGEMTTPIPGAETVSTTAPMRSPAITALKEAFANDVNPQTGTMPYGAIKQLRTAIGEKITNPSLINDIPSAQWRQLYGALSADMGAAAGSAGPQASQAFARANAYTAAGHARIDDVLNRVVNQGTAEKVYLAAVNPSEIRQGGTTVTAVMRSLEPEERNVVTGTVIRRLGLANPGAQNDLGEQFSSQTFLTNWNKVSPEARRALFPNSGLRQNLDQIASASNMIKEGAKVFANPSGTAPALSNQLSRWTIAGAVVMGRPDLAVTFGSLLLGAHWSARLMVKPEFVSWLARSTTVPQGAGPALVNSIVQQSRKWTAEDRIALKQGISAASLPSR